jgi:hypothetical protein
MMGKRRDWEGVYFDRVRKEREALLEFAERGREDAEMLFAVYRARKADMPDAEYRPAAFFMNKEYLLKPGSLFLLYDTAQRLGQELPPATKETAVELLRYRFEVYSRILDEGGF